MTNYPFDPEDLSPDAQALLSASAPTTRLSLADQLRADVEAERNAVNFVALAWTLTEIVKSEVYVDDLWNDIQDAKEALDTALVLEPELMHNGPFVEQQERTGVVYDRIHKFEQAEQARLSNAKNKSDGDLSAIQAADIAYDSKNPEEMAHYFLLAAKKTEATDPGQANWYLNNRTSALLDLGRWGEAEPQLRQMTQDNTAGGFWVEEGYVGLLRIAAAQSDARAFKRIWRQAQFASSAIPGITPQYYNVLRFGVEQDFFEFVDPVVRRLYENKDYKKTKEDIELLDLASNYIQQKSLQTPWSKLRAFFRVRK